MAMTKAELQEALGAVQAENAALREQVAALSAPAPVGPAFVRFCAPGSFPGGAVSAGMVMRSPSPEVLERCPHIWISEREYETSARKFRAG